MGIFIDPQEIINTSSGADAKIQLLFLLVAYGYILSKSSALISDGSELLLLIPSLAGIVGSIVLPVLGAVPDGAIVLFSGFGAPEQVQAQLNVGVGALAGSTIMLLTIPWALCIIMGRVDLVRGEAAYKGKPKLTRTSLTHIFTTGVTPRSSITKNGIIMIITSISYVVIQGAAFGSSCEEGDDKGCRKEAEHWWAFAALFICVASFAGYMVYNVKFADEEDKEDFIAEVKKDAIEAHIISLSAAFEFELSTHPVAETSLLSVEDRERRFDDTVKKFFKKYDTNGNGVIDKFELKALLKDVGEEMPEEKFTVFLKEIDTDGNGNISYKEFSAAMKNFLARKMETFNSGSGEISIHTSLPAINDGAEEPENPDASEEEEEEVPEDLASLPPNKQKMRILLRAGWMMGLGTAVVLLFSDPMVDVLNGLGTAFSVNPFYVAFVLAPVASNASELIASINYATKKTKKTITISLGALEGAACMNNTFCLGIFLCLIFFKGLAWEFSAETISILAVEAAMFLFALLKTHKIFHAIIVFSLYPISIFLVWFLENVAGLN